MAALERWRPRRMARSTQSQSLIPSGGLWDPFQEINRLQSGVDRMFSAMAPFAPVVGPASAYVPDVDIYEDDKSIHLEADLPGIEKKDLNIRLEGQSLYLEGERKEEEAKRRDFLRSERGYGNFSRCFTLPDYADPDKIDANFKNGVLDVTIAKKEGVQPKEIPIKAEAA